jgi:hypothetical protein
MARVLPFPALLSTLDARLQPEQGSGTAGRSPQPSHVRPLLEAPDPAAELGRQRASGALLRDARPALYLLELLPEGAASSRAAPVRYLLCGLTQDGAEPLEHSPYVPRCAQVEPAVTLAADDHGVLRELLAEAAERSVLVWHGSFDGWQLSLKRIEAAEITRRLQAALDEAPLRPLSALDERAPSLAAVVALSEPGLHLAPVHRGIRNLDTFNEDTFLRLAGGYARSYDLTESLTSPGGLEAARERLATLITGHHAVLLVLPQGRGRILRFRQGLDLAHIRAVPRNPTLRSLDLALLNALVLRTVLGIQDPETPGHPNVFAVHSLEELVEGVESGTYQVGFGLNPPPVWEVRAVMEASATLPPRTLRVDPMPPAGLLFLDRDA